MNWRDNPWFPKVLDAERLDLKERDPDAYMHVWEGHCKEILAGAIFAKELRKAKLEERITDVPYNPTKPVYTFWDLGWNSVTGRTAIIMAQAVDGWYHIIDYMEDAEHPVAWYVSELQKKPYVWGTDYLPHDADSTNLAAGGKTVKKLMQGLGRKVKVMPRTKSVGSDIDVCRLLFPLIRMDKQKAADLLYCLNRYIYKVDEETGLRSKLPEPNLYIHGADSFRTFATAIQEDKKPVKKEPAYRPTYTGGGAWMG